MTNNEDLTVNDLIGNRNNIPAEYVPVKLSSCGKLGLPSVLHIKDYSFDDAVSLSQMTELNAESVVLNVLNNVCYETIDTNKITIQDAMEIMLTIYGTWHNSTITKTYIDDDGKEKEALIKIGDINTIPISGTVKFPLKISGKGKTALFDYPRIAMVARAKAYVEELYSASDNRMSSIRHKVLTDKATYEEKNQLKEYENKKNATFAKCINALQIISYNGKTSESIEEKMAWLDDMGIKMFNLSQKSISDKVRFGIDDNITFKDGSTGETKIRRLPFRLFDVISIVGYEDDKEYSIAFGE